MNGDASGVGDVTMGATTPINTFTADTTGPISLESTGTASNFTLTANDGGNALLTIKSSNGGAGQGNILIEADDTLTMQTLSSTINIGTNAVAQNITVGNQTGTSRVDIDTGSGGFHIDANDNATVSADSTINVAGDLTTTLDEIQAADSGNPGNAYTVTTGDGATAGVTNPGGTGGNLHLFGGSGGDAQLAANAGGAGAEIHMLSGTGGAGATALAAGTGGLLKLEAGDAGAPNGGPGGTGGAVDIDAGAGVTGGNVTIDAGAGTTTDGSITIGTTVGSTNAVVIGNSTDHGITMSMSQSNNQFDIERFLTTATGAALAITYDAASRNRSGTL
jgi:hypothetical protein